MNYTTPCSHPLHITCTNYTGVAHAVAMFNNAFQYVGNGFYATVRVPWKTRKLFLRVGCVKIVQHKERIEERYLMVTKGSLEVHTSSLDCRDTM